MLEEQIFLKLTHKLGSYISFKQCYNTFGTPCIIKALDEFNEAWANLLYAKNIRQRPPGHTDAPSPKQSRKSEENREIPYALVQRSITQLKEAHI